MAQSPLLTLARDSIVEVFQAENIVNRQKLLEEFPLLKEVVATQVTIYVENVVHSYATTLRAKKSLLEDVAYNAKSAAFLSDNVLSTSQYIHSEIEVALITPLTDKKTFLQEEFLRYLNHANYGIILHTDSNDVHIPSHVNSDTLNDFLDHDTTQRDILNYSLYTLEKARDSAIATQEEHHA